MLPESKALSFAVTVCGKRSLFTHTIRSPRCTVSCGGLNCIPSIVTVCCVAGTARLENSRPPAPSSTRFARASRTRGVPSGATLQFRLDLLCMIKVRDKSWPHLDQESFQLGILRTRNECFVHCLQHGLVIGDLVVDISLVEGTAAETLQRSEVLVATFLQALAGRVRFRRHVQFL